MSMLYYFFNVRNESRKLFEGLEISRNHELCEKWLNKWPTIFLTFKDIDGLDFASAYDQLVFTISDLYQKFILQKRVYGENAGVLERVILQFISYNLL